MDAEYPLRSRPDITLETTVDELPIWFLVGSFVMAALISLLVALHISLVQIYRRRLKKIHQECTLVRGDQLTWKPSWWLANKVTCYTYVQCLFCTKKPLITGLDDITDDYAYEDSPYYVPNNIPALPPPRVFQTERLCDDRSRNYSEDDRPESDRSSQDSDEQILDHNERRRDISHGDKQKNNKIGLKEPVPNMSNDQTCQEHCPTTKSDKSTKVTQSLPHYTENYQNMTMFPHGGAVMVPFPPPIRIASPLTPKTAENELVQSLQYQESLIHSLRETNPNTMQPGYNYLPHLSGVTTQHQPASVNAISYQKPSSSSGISPYIPPQCGQNIPQQPQQNHFPDVDAQQRHMGTTHSPNETILHAPLETDDIGRRLDAISETPSINARPLNGQEAEIKREIIDDIINFLKNKKLENQNDKIQRNEAGNKPKSKPILKRGDSFLHKNAHVSYSRKNEVFVGGSSQVSSSVSEDNAYVQNDILESVLSMDSHIIDTDSGGKPVVHAGSNTTVEDSGFSIFDNDSTYAHVSIQVDKKERDKLYESITIDTNDRKEGDQLYESTTIETNDKKERDQLYESTTINTKDNDDNKNACKSEEDTMEFLGSFNNFVNQRARTYIVYSALLYKHLDTCRQLDTFYPHYPSEEESTTPSVVPFPFPCEVTCIAHFCRSYILEEGKELGIIEEIDDVETIKVFDDESIFLSVYGDSIIYNLTPSVSSTSPCNSVARFSTVSRTTNNNVRIEVCKILMNTIRIWEEREKMSHVQTSILTCIPNTPLYTCCLDVVDEKIIEIPCIFENNAHHTIAIVPMRGLNSIAVNYKTGTFTNEINIKMHESMNESSYSGYSQQLPEKFMPAFVGTPCSYPPYHYGTQNMFDNNVNTLTNPLQMFNRGAYPLPLQFDTRNEQFIRTPCRLPTDSAVYVQNELHTQQYLPYPHHVGDNEQSRTHHLSNAMARFNNKDEEIIHGRDSLAVTTSSKPFGNNQQTHFHNNTSNGQPGIISKFHFQDRSDNFQNVASVKSHLKPSCRPEISNNNVKQTMSEPKFLPIDDNNVTATNLSSSFDSQQLYTKHSHPKKSVSSMKKRGYKLDSNRIESGGMNISLHEIEFNNRDDVASKKVFDVSKAPISITSKADLSEIAGYTASIIRDTSDDNCLENTLSDLIDGIIQGDEQTLVVNKAIRATVKHGVGRPKDNLMWFDSDSEIDDCGCSPFVVAKKIEGKSTCDTSDNKSKGDKPNVVVSSSVAKPVQNSHPFFLSDSVLGFSDLDGRTMLNNIDTQGENTKIRGEYGLKNPICTIQTSKSNAYTIRNGSGKFISQVSDHNIDFAWPQMQGIEDTERIIARQPEKFIGPANETQSSNGMDYLSINHTDKTDNETTYDSDNSKTTYDRKERGIRKRISMFERTAVSAHAVERFSKSLPSSPLNTTKNTVEKRVKFATGVDNDKSECSEKASDSSDSFQSLRDYFESKSRNHRSLQSKNNSNSDILTNFDSEIAYHFENEDGALIKNDQMAHTVPVPTIISGFGLGNGDQQRILVPKEKKEELHEKNIDCKLPIENCHNYEFQLPAFETSANNKSLSTNNETGDNSLDMSSLSEKLEPANVSWTFSQSATESEDDGPYIIDMQSKD